MNQPMFKCLSQCAILVLALLALVELSLAIWTVVEPRYKSLAYNLADVGYIDLWILRYLSLCLFVTSIITLVMCLILVWGLYSAHVFLFIASTMIVFLIIAEFVIAILTFTSKYETRLVLLEQLPKLVITYRQGTDERARRALDFLQQSFRCCGSDGRLSFQNNVPSSCQMFSVGCLTRSIYFLNVSMDTLAFLLLFFSLIRLFLVIFFYSYLCLSEHDRRRLKRKTTNLHSSSLDSSSVESLSTKVRLNGDDRHENAFLMAANANDYEDSRISRKLSSISEKTERTETDGSENELHRLRYSNIKRNASPPLIKNRRRYNQDDEYEQNDSGVEPSSSEKSFDESKFHYETTILPTTTLAFSKVFVTSIDPPAAALRMKPILKKSSAPQPTPRLTLRQDESLV